MTYFSEDQVAQLLRGINPKRVSTDGKGFSHVEAYEIRAHLNRVIGFGRWSADLTELAPIFESSEVVRKKNRQGEEYGDPYEAWTVCYRATVRLTVCAPDGTTLATYTEAATGEAKNQPHRGDAHDLAIKTAESQAMKRAAVNLGDNYGLSLYAKGSTAALVKATLVMPGTEAAGEAVDSHITEQLPREEEPHEPEPDPRVTNAPQAPAPAAPKPVKTGPDPQQVANQIRQQSIDGPPEDWTGSKQRWISHLMGLAVKEKVQNVKVESLTSTEQVALRALLEARLSAAVSEDRSAGARETVTT